MKRAFVYIIAAVLGFTNMGLALGDEGSRRDRNESGSQMRLDVARIAHGHRWRSRTRMLLHEVRLHEPVASRDFPDGFGGLQLLFDVDDDPRDERAIRFFINPDGRPTALLYKGGPRTLGFVNWWRPDKHTVKIEFPKSLLGKGIAEYRWRVLAAQSAPCDPNPPGMYVDGCVDGTRWLVHKL